jgi:hypothetical protein
LRRHTAADQYRIYFISCFLAHGALIGARRCSSSKRRAAFTSLAQIGRLGSRAPRGPGRPGPPPARQAVTGTGSPPTISQGAGPWLPRRLTRKCDGADLNHCWNRCQPARTRSHGVGNRDRVYGIPADDGRRLGTGPGPVGSWFKNSNLRPWRDSPEASPSDYPGEPSETDHDDVSGFLLPEMSRDSEP